MTTEKSATWRLSEHQGTAKHTAPSAGSSPVTAWARLPAQGSQQQHAPRTGHGPSPWFPLEPPPQPTAAGFNLAGAGDRAGWCEGCYSHPWICHPHPQRVSCHPCVPRRHSAAIGTCWLGRPLSPRAPGETEAAAPALGTNRGSLRGSPAARAAGAGSARGLAGGPALRAEPGQGPSTLRRSRGAAPSRPGGQWGWAGRAFPRPLPGSPPEIPAPHRCATPGSLRRHPPGPVPPSRRPAPLSRRARGAPAGSRHRPAPLPRAAPSPLRSAPPAGPAGSPAVPERRRGPRGAAGLAGLSGLPGGGVSGTGWLPAAGAVPHRYKRKRRGGRDRRLRHLRRARARSPVSAPGSPAGQVALGWEPLPSACPLQPPGERWGAGQSPLLPPPARGGGSVAQG